MEYEIRWAMGDEIPQALDLAFYKHYGFAVLEEERNTDTPWKTPMWYPLSM